MTQKLSGSRAVHRPLQGNLLIDKFRSRDSGTCLISSKHPYGVNACRFCAQQLPDIFSRLLGIPSRRGGLLTTSVQTNGECLTWHYYLYKRHKKSALGRFFHNKPVLATQAQTLDQIKITFCVLTFQVIKQFTTLANHAKQTTT